MKLSGNLVVFVLLVDFCIATTDNEVAIPKQMKEWGKAMFLSIETSRLSNKGQYLVAVVLEDAPDPSSFPKYLFNGCPAKPNFEEKLLECRSSAVILNLVSTEVWERSQWANEPKYETQLWHGEYRFLKDGIVRRLTYNFFSDRENVRCKIFLYSFFIPCTQLGKTPFACSNIISNYNNDPTTKCKITLIGYSEVFQSPHVSTHQTKAESVLQVCSDLVQLKKEIQLKAISAVKTQRNFQELMFECLINSPLSGCCVDEQQAGENSQLVVSYFVNAVIYKLKNDRSVVNHSFDKHLKSKLKKYIKEKLWQTIGGDCYLCSTSNLVPVYLINFCSETALDISDYFGKPETYHDLSIPRWIPIEDGKIKIEMNNPDDFKKQKTIKCAMGTLSIDSLCTKDPSRNNKITRNNQGTLNILSIGSSG